MIGRQGHLPFGEDFAESSSQEKHHFTSYERDSEVASDYAVNRQYNQSVGRFSRVDPFNPGINNPQALNRFAYAMNEPVNSVDPAGLYIGPVDGPDPCDDPILGPILCPRFPPLVPPEKGGGNRNPPSCDIQLYLTGTHVGTWPAAERFSNFDPNTRNHGGGISSDSPPRWFYYFEVFVPIALQDRAGWTFNQSTTASGRFTIDLGNGSTRERRFFQQDPTDNPTENNRQWRDDGRLWLDAPSFATTQPGPGAGRFKVISARIQFVITITARKGNTFCRNTLFLALTVENGQASWVTIETP